MLTTSHSFIHEYSLFDEVFDALESCKKEADVIFYNYGKAKDNNSVASFFEGTSDDFVMEQEAQGVLAKIGNLIVGLIKKITDFLKGISEKIFGSSKQLQTDAEIVSKMCAEHPELKDTIARGINEEWFTYKDVAAFEKDTVALIAMLEKNAIDHRTFREKFAAIADKFKKSAAPIITIGGTAAAVFGILPKLAKGCKEAKDTVGNFNKHLNDFKEKVDSKYSSDDDINKAQAIMSVMSEAINLTTGECKDRTKGQGAIGGFFSKLANGKVGKALHLDDDSKADRKDAAKKRVSDREAAIADKKAQEEADAKAARQKKIADDVADEKYKKEQRKAAGLSTDNGGKKKK